MPSKTLAKPLHVTPELPAIDQRLFHALKADIALRGILVPLVYCAHTRQCIDGRVRLMIADQLGIRVIPKVFVGHLRGNDKEDIRVALNGLRRQLSREQLQEVIAWSLRKHPDVSDREIGRRVGVDHKAVGRTRKRLEATGAQPQSPKRVGGDGRSRPVVYAHRPGSSSEGLAQATDYYSTDEATARYLPERETFDGWVTEPCSGDGSLVRVLRRYGIKVRASDLRTDGVEGTGGVDMFRMKKQKNIVTNPPYTQIDRAVDHLVKITECKCALLLPMWMITGKTRRPWWIKNPPQRIYPLPWRSQFLLGGTDKTNQYWGYCWFVWDRQRRGEPTVLVWE